MHYIQKKVKELTTQYGTQDPFELAKEMGLEVWYFQFTKIKGLVLTLDGNDVIVLNSELPEYFQRAVLAHELGHYTLSPTGAGYFFVSENTLMESKVEYEANRFAIELLTLDETPEVDETLEQFGARLGIPKEMIRLINKT